MIARVCRLVPTFSYFGKGPPRRDGYFAVNFVATRYPASIAQRVEIHNIPVKRAPPCYLDPAEMAPILAQPDVR